MLLRALVIAAAVLALPAAAGASTGPCVPGSSQPRCNFKMARVTFIADGDTIRAREAGSRSVKRIRFTGINAMELHRYSKYASRRRGDCHGVEATAVVERAIKRSHGTVRLVEQDIHSVSNKRLRRSVWAKSNGRGRDVSKLERQ